MDNQVRHPFSTQAMAPRYSNNDNHHQPQPRTTGCFPRLRRLRTHPSPSRQRTFSSHSVPTLPSNMPSKQQPPTTYPSLSSSSPSPSPSPSSPSSPFNSTLSLARISSSTSTTVTTDTFRNPQQQNTHPLSTMSLLARARRRRKIRAKLDEVAKVVSSPQVDHEDALALFSETDCALLTDHGEIIVSTSTKTTSSHHTSSRSFIESIAPKIKLLRHSTNSLSTYLNPTSNENLQAIHIRGHAVILHTYILGKHTLIAVTEVSPGARNLDTVVDRVDRCLGISGHGHTLIRQLQDMLN